MVTITTPPRPAIFLIVVMSMILSTSAFPQPNLQPFHRNAPPAGQEDTFGEQWEMLYPSISLLNWDNQMLTGPDFSATDYRTQQLPMDEWIPPSQSETEEKLTKGWPQYWLQPVSNRAKRNIVVADDAAFRERSKLLTAMERQKWLNSYMQKLLVVNSK